MTYRQWEWEMKCLLRGFPRNEARSIIAYYQEIYGDKKEAGFSDSEILLEFGTPEECYEKIQNENPEIAQSCKIEKRQDIGLLALKIIGIIFLAVFVLIPLGSIVLGVVAIFAAACVGSGVLSIGGIVVAGWSMAMLISGATFASSMATFGMGIAMVGAGALFSVAFFLLTKYVAVVIYKCVTYFIYKYR